MAYEDLQIVQEWLDSLGELDVKVKKMFGCYCLYCDGQAVGWIYDSVMSLREVGLDYLPDDIKRPSKDEMIDTLRKKSQNVFELKAGTLYPLLHGLEEKGMLKVYEQEFLGKTRKYYSITKEGKKLLKGKTEEWNEYSAAIANVLAMGCDNGGVHQEALRSGTI